MAMMAMTTNNSIKVKPQVRFAFPPKLLLVNFMGLRMLCNTLYYFELNMPTAFFPSRPFCAIFDAPLCLLALERLWVTRLFAHDTEAPPGIIADDFGLRWR